MTLFDDATRIAPAPASADDATDTRRFTAEVQTGWSVGTHPNGGYLMALAGRALCQLIPTQPDPLSLTVHYLRPGLAGQPCEIRTRMLRSGRTLSTVQATLLQEGSARLELIASMGDLGPRERTPPPVIALPRPSLPPPDQCPARSASAQGVEIPLLSRIDVRLNPAEAAPGAAGQARVSGWSRFSDGRAPDALACLLMSDAFPPAVFGLLGKVGWVPTIELTIHLRRRPAPGWMLGQFWSHDLSDGRVLEDGALWDSEGHLVLQSRQLALVRQEG